MELGDDLTSERMMARYVNVSIVLQESSFTRDSSFVGKGCLYPFVPQFFLSSGFLDLRMCFVSCGHNECPEVSGSKDDDVSVVILALIVIIATRQ